MIRTKTPSNPLSQTVGGVTTEYTLDRNAGLTQVLADGTDTYLNGLMRLRTKIMVIIHATIPASPPKETNVEDAGTNLENI